MLHSGGCSEVCAMIRYSCDKPDIGMRYAWDMTEVSDRGQLPWHRILNKRHFSTKLSGSAEPPTHQHRHPTTCRICIFWRFLCGVPTYSVRCPLLFVALVVCSIPSSLRSFCTVFSVDNLDSIFDSKFSSECGKFQLISLVVNPAQLVSPSVALLAKLALGTNTRFLGISECCI